MDRKEFLALIGGGAAVFSLGSCLQSCTKVNQPSVDFTINLSDPAYAVLKTAGGYMYANGVIVAHTISGAYVAVSQTCTHGGTNVVYETGKDNFYCPTHFATFTTSGVVKAGPANKNLRSYNTSLNSNNLHIWS